MNQKLQNLIGNRLIDWEQGDISAQDFINWIDEHFVSKEEVKEVIGEDERNAPVTDIYRTPQELRDYCSERVVRDDFRQKMREKLGLKESDD